MVSQYVLRAWAARPPSVTYTCPRCGGFWTAFCGGMWCLLNPAASMSGVKETVVEGKTPEITIEQARKLIASVRTTYTVKVKGLEPEEVVSVVGLRDRAILVTLAYTACRAGAIAKLRLQDFQHDGEQYVLRFQEKGGKSREIPVRLELQRDILAYIEALASPADNKDQPLFARRCAGRSN